MSVLGFIKNISAKVKINILIIMIVVVLIWLVLPYIEINNSQPFASMQVRCLLTLIAALLAICKVLLDKVQEHKSGFLKVFLARIRAVWGAIKSSKTAFCSYTQYKYSLIKNKLVQDHKKRSLNRLPWYLVLGTQNSGKSTLIHSMNINYVKPEYFGEEAQRYLQDIPNYDWWFSEQAVMIEPVKQEQDENELSWRKFIKLLKRERKNKPVNGIIVTFELSDLLLYANQDRQAFIQQIAHSIRSLHTAFSAQIPVYVIFNKSDAVEGFMEFFNDLSHEELRQVMGVSFPIELCNEPGFSIDHFQREYSKIIDKLTRRIMWAFDSERSLRGRELINSFPQQMQLFRRPLESFIAELFGSTRYPKALQLRGIYFTSCNQDPLQSHDFLLQAMSKKFQLVPPQFERPARMSESYFTRNIFFQMIYPESRYLGESERSKRVRKYNYTAALVMAPVIMVALTYMLYHGYQYNRRELKQARDSLVRFNLAEQQFASNDSSIEHTLPLLDALEFSSEIYQQAPFSSRMIFTDLRTENAINAALERTLSSAYLPRIAAKLESDLDKNIVDQNLLYATLKGYLAFSSTESSDALALKAPMEYQWAMVHKGDPIVENKLRNYLNMAIQSPVDKLPLNQLLINRVRRNLAEIVPADRAYGLLKLRASVTDLADLGLDSSSGVLFSKVFTDANKQSAIPALYTYKGYKNIFKKTNTDIAKEVAEDNKAVGLDANLEKGNDYKKISYITQSKYSKDYVDIWNTELKHINIIKFKDIKHAVSVLNAILSQDSPVANILNIVYYNTDSIHGHNFTIARQFKPINEYYKSDASHASWKQMSQTLAELKQYLQKINDTPDPHAAAYKISMEIISGKSKDNPLIKLLEEAHEAPSPMSRWLNQIAQNSWQVIAENAQEYLNGHWADDVYANYSNAVNYKYPFKTTAKSQISIEDFSSLFSKSGDMEKYFKHYLKPFINTTTTPWSLYRVSGLSMHIPHESVHLFERANQIRHAYFSGKGDHAKIKFDIQPVTLSSDASSVRLAFGSKVLLYQHGPRVISSITWPLADGQEQSSITLTDFNPNQHRYSTYGPWSIFQIFQHGKVNHLSGDGTYLYTVNLDGYKASYKLSGITGNVFNLHLLANFRLPSHIAKHIQNKD